MGGDQVWNGDLVHDAGNVVADVSGFLTGPPGDPGRIRQVATQIDGIHHRVVQDRRALDEAVGELTATWQGDGAMAFAARWRGGPGESGAPARVLERAADDLHSFAGRLNDYADQLENAQHQHWIQMALMAAMTVVNAAQLGCDPATDAAEVGMGLAADVGTDFALPALGNFAVEQACVGFGTDLISQFGTDVWDHLDPNFDRTGHHVVSLFNAEEAAMALVPAGGGIASEGTAVRGGLGDAETAVGADVFAPLQSIQSTAQSAAESYAAELRAAGGRIPTAASAAVDKTTGATYTGHSGELSAPPERLIDILPNPSREPWAAWNCAEAAACDKALRAGSSLDDLQIYSVRTKTGEFFPPCDNCAAWLPGGSP